MGKKVYQFRYYTDESSNNQPNDDNNNLRTKLQNGTIFDGYFPIIQLGIQALPGTKFYLNKAITPIVIGSTGIYELDLEGYAEITGLNFAQESLDLIDKNPNAYLIIDIIYEDREEIG